MDAPLSQTCTPSRWSSLWSRRRGLAALAGLNALLLGTWWLASLPSAATAAAQPAGLSRPRGQYVMVSGRIQGPNHAVYILDVLNQELIALRWDSGSRRLQGLGYRNVADDAMQAAGGAR